MKVYLAAGMALNKDPSKKVVQILKFVKEQIETVHKRIKMVCNPKAIWEAASFSEAVELVGGDFENVGELSTRILLHLGARKGHKVLDIGCGCGRTAHILIRHLNPEDYYGCDVAQSMIEYVMQITNGKGNFVVFNGTHLPHDDDFFDYVFAFSVITHTSSRVTKSLISESKRVLRNTGIGIFSFVEEEGAVARGHLGKRTWDKDLLIELFKELNLEVEYVHAEPKPAHILLKEQEPSCGQSLIIFWKTTQAPAPPPFR